MSDEVLIALIGGAVTVIVAVIGVWQNKKKGKKLDQAEKEMRFQRVALGFSEFVEEWDAIASEVRSLMEQTTLDRFLILRAWNGHHEPRWTTAVYQMRKDDQSPIPYIHFELDPDYQWRIREILGKNQMYFRVEDLAPCSIKDIYEAEGITASMWAILDTFALPDSSSKAVIYCSFATRSGEYMDSATRTRCMLLVSRLKGIVSAFHDENVRLK